MVPVHAELVQCRVSLNSAATTDVNSTIHAHTLKTDAGCKCTRATPFNYRDTALWYNDFLESKLAQHICVPIGSTYVLLKPLWSTVFVSS